MALPADVALADGYSPILSECVSLTRAVDIQTGPVPNFINTQFY
jgi:hypothetical protein